MNKIVIVTDSFKGCLSSQEVEKAVETGIHSVLSTCQTVCIPIADGGEGMLEVMVEMTHGEYCEVTVHDPLMRTIPARYGILGDKETVVIEMAQASGLPLLRPEERNPLETTSFGTGELILHALEKGYHKFLIGIGGSATNDAGIGMMQALGAKFMKQNGELIGIGCGKQLADIYYVNLDRFKSLIHQATFTIACDVNNPFCGINGAAAVFAPQKGATINDVTVLEKGMQSFATQIFKSTGQDIIDLPGAGAAGGLGGSFYAFFNATLIPGIELILETAHFKERIKDADLIITGEGKSDRQTLMGKVAMGILKEGMAANVPVILLSGSIADIQALNDAGFTAVLSVTPEPMELERAIQAETAYKNIIQASSQIIRLANTFDNRVSE